MGIFWDIAGSLIIRGMIAAIVVTMNVMLNDIMFERTSQSIVKQNVAILSDIIRDDVQYIGQSVASGPMVTKGTTDFRFYGDIDFDWIVEDVRYYFEADPLHLGTMIVYRSIDGFNPTEVGRGITSWNLIFYDWQGTECVQGSATSFKLQFTMRGFEELKGNDGQPFYPTQSWEMHFFPQPMLTQGNL